MPPTSSLDEALGGTRSILPECDNETSDTSFTTAPEQPDPSQYESLPSMNRVQSTSLENETFISAVYDAFLSNDARTLTGGNTNIPDIGDTANCSRQSDEKNKMWTGANEHGVSMEMTRRQGSTIEGIQGRTVVEPSSRPNAFSEQDAHDDRTAFNQVEPIVGMYQDSANRLVEALNRALHGEPEPADADAWMDPDSGHYHSESDHDEWADSRSDGDTSAVEEFDNVEYSFSDVALSDVETIDEDSIEMDYPSDQDWTGSMSEGDSNDDLYDSSEDSVQEELNAGRWVSRSSDKKGTTVAPIPSEPCSVPNNDGLSVQLKTRNPWRTLQRYHPHPKETTAAGSFFPINRLPTELLCIVAKHLPAESAACLALSSKIIYMAMGTQYLRFEDKSSLWEFLLLIESERQASFACCVCLELHRPSISQLIGVSKCTKLWSKREKNRLPASITSGLVKMIGRKHLEDPRQCQEYLSWAAESDKMTTRHIKFAQHVTPRMVDGNLLIKTETYVHPFHDGELTHRSLYELFRLLRPSWTEKKLYSICAHHSWERELDIHSKWRGFCDDPLATKCDRNACSRDIHRRECYGNDVVLDWRKKVILPRMMASMLQPDPSTETPSQSLIVGEGVRSCLQCATDYCITAREVSGVGRCMVFTTWKDLGGVRPGEDNKWDTFFTPKHSRNGFIPQRRTKWLDVPERYLTYQNLRVPRSSENHRMVFPYEPEPDWKMVRDLTRRVKKFVFPNGDGDYLANESHQNTDTE